MKRKRLHPQDDAAAKSEISQTHQNETQVPSTKEPGREYGQQISGENKLQHDLKTSTKILADAHRGVQISADRETLLGIFPEEIWDLVLDCVKEPRDFENISSASPFFQNLVQQRKVLYLFPSVWEILGLKYELESYKDSSYNSVIQDDCPATRDRYMSKENGTCTSCGRKLYIHWYSAILNMRSVCRTWNDVIDTYFQYAPVVETLPGWRRDEFVTTSGDSAAKFMDHFASTHIGGALEKRNPFLGRSISLELFVWEDLPQGYKDDMKHVWSMVEKFGRHIWHCSIEMGCSAQDVSEFYMKLRELLRLMPHLKTLGIEFGPEDLSMEFDDSAEEIHPIHSLIRENPMPRMAHLHSFDINSCVPLPIYNEIIRCGTSMSNIGWFPGQEFIRGNLEHLRNLKEMSVNVESESYFTQIMHSGGQINLEKLRLDFGTTSLSWPAIVSGINSTVWTTTLTDLALQLSSAGQEMSGANYIMDNSTLRLNLTRLRRLKLELGHYSSLDFLLPMRDTLETLEISLRRWDEMSMDMVSLQVLSEQEETVKFIEYFDRPLESNIWKIFKKLRRFASRGFIMLNGEPAREFDWSHSRCDWLAKQYQNENK